MAQALSKAVSVAARTRDGIGHAARRNNAGVAFILPGLRTDRKSIAPALHGRRRLVQADMHAGAAEAVIQELAHFNGAVGLGKNAAAAFYLRFQSPLMQQVQQVFIGKLAVGAVQEFPISRRMGDELVHGAGIGQIAAALAGNAHLFSDDIIFFQQRNRRALSGRGQGGHDAGGAGADDNDVFHQTFPPFYLYLYSSATSSGFRLRYEPRLTPLRVKKAYWTRRKLCT